MNVLGDWKNLNIESGGARVKSVISPPNSSQKFLFKVPKYGPFETDTEIFNSILACELGIRHTQYYRGFFEPLGFGVFCKSFLNEDAVDDLWEMKELLCRYANKPALEQKMGRDQDVLKEHTVDMIFLILETEFDSSAILQSFFEMIGFDALIGHGDRHWSNYGVIVSGRPIAARFSPIYDTASGFLIEHPEEKCQQMLREELLDPKWYRPKSRGLCKITVPGSIKSNHFDLVEYILENENMRRYNAALKKAFKSFNPVVVRGILNRFFPEMSPIRKATIEQILNMRWQIGLEIFDKAKGPK
ncbi:MAG: hypothetical protein KF789_15090 [Bdellovibrionaceae bacterium]|nr:hypothetical protein [Pseudobdellovibrionaceae bacterium]